MLGRRSACVLCVETSARECSCPASVSQQCFTTLLISHLCMLSEVIVPSEISIVIIVVLVIVIAIEIAGLAAGIATVSCCVCIKWRKKTTASVGGTQDHGELQ